METKPIKLFVDTALQTITFEMNMDDINVEHFLTTATPTSCVSIMEAVVHDIKNAMKPDALHIKLGAHARELDTDIYRELVLAEHLKVLETATARLRQLLGINA
jgi:hypothetical protein